MAEKAEKHVTAEEIAELQANPKLAHQRTNDFRIALATGVTISIFEGRIEFDFFADRQYPSEELLKKVEGVEDQYQATGLAKVTTVREHLVGASISKATAESVVTLLKQTIDKMD